MSYVINLNDVRRIRKLRPPLVYDKTCGDCGGIEFNICKRLTFIRIYCVNCGSRITGLEVHETDK